jgi:hypothetical protein
MAVVVMVMAVAVRRVPFRRRRRSTLTLTAAADVRAAGGQLAHHLPVSSARATLPLPNLRDGGGLHVCANFLQRPNTNESSRRRNHRRVRSAPTQVSLCVRGCVDGGGVVDGEAEPRRRWRCGDVFIHDACGGCDHESVGKRERFPQRRFQATLGTSSVASFNRKVPLLPT